MLKLENLMLKCEKHKTWVKKPNPKEKGCNYERESTGGNG